MLDLVTSRKGKNRASPSRCIRDQVNRGRKGRLIWKGSRAVRLGHRRTGLMEEGMRRAPSFTQPHVNNLCLPLSFWSVCRRRQFPEKAPARAPAEDIVCPTRSTSRSIKPAFRRTRTLSFIEAFIERRGSLFGGKRQLNMENIREGYHVPFPPLLSMLALTVRLQGRKLY